MNEERLQQHLSKITTMWTVLFQANQGPADQTSAAQRQLLQRDSAAIYRYLLGAVRDTDTADDLFQEFAVRFLRGDLKRACPERGRFRDFLKTVLYHLIVDHQRGQKKRPVSLPPAGLEPSVAPPKSADADEEFLTAWRADLMARTWQALERFEQQTGQPYCTVLRFRADHPEIRSPQMVEYLAEQLGQAVTPAWIRKRLHFAREKFTDLLVEEVVQTLEETQRRATGAGVARSRFVRLLPGGLGEASTGARRCIMSSKFPHGGST